jgi:hypothetical protein
METNTVWVVEKFICGQWLPHAAYVDKEAATTHQEAAEQAYPSERFQTVGYVKEG